MLFGRMYPGTAAGPNRSSDPANSNNVKLTMEDDCWSIEALRDVNSLAASIALKTNLMAMMWFSLI